MLLCVKEEGEIQSNKTWTSLKGDSFQIWLFECSCTVCTKSKAFKKWPNKSKSQNIIMGAIFEVMSSVVSNPPPELQVADTLITLSLKLRPCRHVSCSSVLNHHKCPRSLSGAITIEFLCGRSIASVWCVLESSDHFVSLRPDSKIWHCANPWDPLFCY